MRRSSPPTAARSWCCWTSSTLVEGVARRWIPCRIPKPRCAKRSNASPYRFSWTTPLTRTKPSWTATATSGPPPYEFAPQLIAAVAHARLRRKEYDAAKALYEEVLRRFPTALIAAEAQYYVGVSAYRASHTASDLLHAWHE